MKAREKEFHLCSISCCPGSQFPQVSVRVHVFVPAQCSELVHLYHVRLDLKIDRDEELIVLKGRKFHKEVVCGAGALLCSSIDYVP